MSRFERWSRRKLGEDAPAEPDRQPGAPSTADAEGEARGDAPVDMAVEPEAPTPGSLDHTLPDPDTLPAGADFSAYLDQGVSRQLRRRALRRLWSAGDYGVRDGLDDYDEDYREVLKPLARDVAEQLRRWTRPSEEAPTETQAEEDEVLVAESQADPAEPEASDDHGDADEPRREALAEERLDQGAIGSDNKFS